MLLLIHTALSALYTLTIPVWEAHDETGHYAYARYLAQHNGRLPPTGFKLDQFDESHQPPLYYWFVALAISGIAATDNIQPTFNPPWWRLWIDPDPQLIAQPWTGTALAVRTGRLVSVILSTLAVGCTFLAGRALFPGKPALALLATALHAFWPLFLGIGSVITNDVAIALFGSLTLWLCARIWQRRAQGPAATDLILLAVCLASASLTKDSAVSLILFGAAIVAGTAILAARRRRHNTLVRIMGLFAIPLTALLIGGVRLSEGRSMRQFIGAGDMAVAASSSVARAVDPIDASTNRVTAFLNSLQTYGGRFAFDSLFGAFGWGAIRMPPEWYWSARIATGVALIGLLLAFRIPHMRPGISLLVFGFLCVGMAPVMRTFLFSEPGLLMGRFFLPGLSALCLLIAVGLYALPGRQAIALGVLSGVAWAGLATPFLVIGPAIAKPPFVLGPYETMRDIQHPTDIVYADSIRLLGYSLTETPASRANGLTIVLYWQSLRRVEANYHLRLELFTLDGRSLYIQRDFEPGFGRFPTSQWTPGDTFAEYYHLPIWPHTPVPAVAQVKASWMRPGSAAALMPECNANSCQAQFGAIPIRLDETETAAWKHAPARFTLGDEIELVDVIAPAHLKSQQPFSVTLVWRSRAAHLVPSTVFIHLVDTNGTLIAQSDSQPCGGDYPTHFWSAGETVPDTHTLNAPDLQDRHYRLLVGMYNSQTQMRLSVIDAGTGERVEHDAIFAGDLDVHIAR